MPYSCQNNLHLSDNPLKNSDRFPIFFSLFSLNLTYTIVFYATILIFPLTFYNPQILPTVKSLKLKALGLNKIEKGKSLHQLIHKKISKCSYVKWVFLKVTETFIFSLILRMNLNPYGC